MGKKLRQAITDSHSRPARMSLHIYMGRLFRERTYGPMTARNSGKATWQGSSGNIRRYPLVKDMKTGHHLVLEWPRQYFSQPELTLALYPHDPSLTSRIKGNLSWPHGLRIDAWRDTSALAS